MSKQELIAMIENAGFEAVERERHNLQPRRYCKGRVRLLSSFTLSEVWVQRSGEGYSR